MSLLPAPGPPPRHNPTPGWNQSLSTGAPGIALVHFTTAREGEEGWETAHSWAAAMTRTPVLAHPDACGLFHGAPAVAYALHAAGHRAYAQALATLDTYITDLVETRLRAAHARIDAGRLPRMREYDLISGLTGLGTYLLYRPGRPSPMFTKLLAYLVRLTEPITVNGRKIPGWWTSDRPDGQPCRRGGHGNLGMAHGVAGPLALAATAMRRGIGVSGQADMISRVSTWVDGWRHGTPETSWWPQTLSSAELADGAIANRHPGRPSWCYGTPGLARARQLAALALGDRAAQQDAEQSLVTCLKDEQQLDQLTDASVCHGWAGLLQTTRAVAADATLELNPALTAQLSRLRGRLDGHLDLHGAPKTNGLLEGTAGVHLATKPPSAGPLSWDACLLLAG
ncbi:lanthionine synthetase C family protein [Streptomyces durbertensis]|uniref:Lanthionine synthetase C family protein n=1 Tax=Streptomyces durbertensis TaxID=2448886 RepID=A0ABR6EIX1_9ACTN|nr:lanthionine synthetase C family protein [Streptomyces durbertensis]MBB1245012.1 lanthionine synthetase C family protein [Streptomyces durbertensis]